MINSLFYFVYFAAFGIFIPYWTLYLHRLELTSMQIATISSIRALGLMVFPILYGYLADRFRMRKNFLVITTIGQVFPNLLMLYFHSYEWLLFLTCVFSVCNAPVLTLAEAATQEEHEGGNLDYGRTRLWGTLGFVVLATGFGKVLDRAGNEWILYGFLIFLVLLIFLSFAMPAGKRHLEFSHESVRRTLLNRNTLILFSCVMLMQVSHGTFYGFYSIYLSELGYSDSNIGLQWGIAAGSELIVFFFASRILKAFPNYLLFSVCLCVASIRWMMMFSTDSYFWLSVYQCFHAFTFGIFHVTTLRLIYKFFPEGSRSLGQSLYTASSGGIGSAIGLLLNGYLWDQQGHFAFLTSSAIAMGAFVLSLFLTRKD